jgi:SAM-dependent methyltransferase
LDLYGFDLTPEMVAEGRRVMTQMGREPDSIWSGSVLDANAFRPPAGAPERFDAAVCVGVLPHVRAEDDGTVLANLYKALAPGGLAVLEARNQLFSLFTMNRYTKAFFDEELIRTEDLAARAAADADKVRAASASLEAHVRMDLPPVRKGREGEPGYDEVLSRTHNPLLLQRQMAGTGFREIRTLFYHFHCLPPMFEAGCPELFKRESLAMEDPEDWRGYFMASAFLVAGRRP